jgi:hypothetical protein
VTGKTLFRLEGRYLQTSEMGNESSEHYGRVEIVGLVLAGFILLDAVLHLKINSQLRINTFKVRSLLTLAIANAAPVNGTGL